MSTVRILAAVNLLGIFVALFVVTTTLARAPQDAVHQLETHMVQGRNALPAMDLNDPDPPPTKINLEQRMHLTMAIDLSRDLLAFNSGRGDRAVILLYGIMVILSINVIGLIRINRTQALSTPAPQSEAAQPAIEADAPTTDPPV